ncbi:hypothetical protein ADUPG1_000989, partial [Aduncisulcus paluster]
KRSVHCADCSSAFRRAIAAGSSHGLRIKRGCRIQCPFRRADSMGYELHHYDDRADHGPDTG